MEIIIPKIGRLENPAGVYKIVFDGKYFYLGSSVNLKSRFFKWKHDLLHGVPKNKRIRELLPSVSKISVEIVEIVYGDLLREREDFYIKFNWGNSMLLNRAEKSTGGFKRTRGEIDNHRAGGLKSARFGCTDKRRMALRESAENRKGSSIVVIDLYTGVFYSSAEELANLLGLSPRTFRRTLKYGKNSRYKRI